MTAGSAARPGYRADIDGLRAVSILLVVAFHAGLDRFAGGYVGVDVFFVLSGFLITGLLVEEQERNARISIRNFYARRIRRLLPLAFLTIVTTLVAGLALVAPLRRSEVAADAIASSLYFADWRFASQSIAYSDGEVTESLFLHFWSLSVEEQFYVVWPLLIIATALFVRRAGVRFRPALAVVLGVVSVASLALSIVQSHQSPDAYYFTHTRVWELGVGAGLALLVPRLGELRPWLAEFLAGAGLVMILAAAVFYGPSTVFPGYAAVLPVLGCAALVVAGAANRPSTSRILSNGAMTYVGRLSYGWYLWHWPAIGVAGLLAVRYGWTETGPLVLGALVVSFVVSAMTHRLVEEPVRRSPRLAARPAMALGIGLLLTTTPVLMALTVPTSSTPVAVAADSDQEQEANDDGSEATGGTVSASPASSVAEVHAMTPEEASEDRVRMQSPGCHAGWQDVEVPKDCVHGSPGGGFTLALVGDSHAQHWLPALDEAGRERGWRVFAWTKDSCTPIDVEIENDRLERDYRECTEWREHLIDRLRAMGTVDLVVIADSARYGGLLRMEGEAVSESDYGKLWEEGAARTFAAYDDVAPKVVVLRDTPWPGNRIPECVSEDPSDPERCSFHLEGKAWLDEEWVAAELSAGGDFVASVDMTEWVCDSDPCRVVTPNGLIKYRDSHHLTATFSRELATPLAEALESVLDRP